VSNGPDAPLVPSPLEGFDSLVPPWRDWENPETLTADEVISRLDLQAGAAFAHEDARPAAIGLVVAVGNYIQAYGGGDYEAILGKTEDLLAEMDPDQGHKWRRRD
jgi:hypothetical protein